MYSIIFLLFIGWACTNMIVNGSIFDFLKYEKLGIISRLFSCIMCTGFWVGVGESILLKNLSNLDIPHIFDLYYIEAAMHGIIISGISVIINSFLIYLIKK